MIDIAPKKYQSVSKLQISDYILTILFDCPFTIRLVSGSSRPAGAIAGGHAAGSFIISSPIRWKLINGKIIQFEQFVDSQNRQFQASKKKIPHYCFHIVAEIRLILCPTP